VPQIDEWKDLLPRFYEGEDDNPFEHVHEFHALMQQLDIHHEDILMKMFMYSLEGDARQWYRTLHASSISSLKDFHDVFYSHCKIIYPAERLFENCCEGYASYIQDSTSDSSSSDDEGDDCREQDLNDEFHNAFPKFEEQMHHSCQNLGPQEKDQYGQSIISLSPPFLDSLSQEVILGSDLFHHENSVAACHERIHSLPVVVVIPPIVNEPVCHDLPSFDDYEDVFTEQPVVPAIVLIPSAINSQMVIDSPLYDDYEDDFHEQSVEDLISEKYPSHQSNNSLFQPSCHIFVAEKEEKDDNLILEGEKLRNWDHKPSYDEYPSQSEDKTEECSFPRTSNCDELPYQPHIPLEDTSSVSSSSQDQMPCDQMRKVEIKERQASLILFPNTPHDQEWTKAICIEDESENQQAIQQPSTVEEGPNAILFLFTQSNVAEASIDDVFQDPFAACLQVESGPRLIDFFNGKCIAKCFFDMPSSKNYLWCLRKHISKLQTVEKMMKWLHWLFHVT
jgi:hypothetical protein